MDEHTTEDTAGQQTGDEPDVRETESVRERRWRELLADGIAGLGTSLGGFRGLP